ncbi:copper-translocating P-t [Byssothecium circinans]|uniref:Copper-translocating P-t n=1 Tax=Byssothecium circinans TaxID=147558 RepID=A0A6A5TJW2_9PLEO|nr:copper-translocating P-t [Byssothecium circinans]
MEGNHRKSCCSAKPTPKPEREVELEKKTCREGCCPTESTPTSDIKIRSLKNGPQEKHVAIEGPSETTPQSTNHSDAPSCCAGKPIPCCDESCIERLAVRDCQFNCAHPEPSETCSDHAAKARKRYTKHLEAFGCICRALVGRGKESCCLPPIKKASSPPKLSPRSSIDSCCAPVAGAEPSPTRPCDDECCGEPKSEDAVRIIQLSPRIDCDIDLEKGVSEKAHIIVSISGMTCTGCETKLQRTLGMLPHVSNLKTSLVLSRAEFELDTGLTSAEEVLKHLERMTEFKCELITNQGSSLDLICMSDSASFVKGHWPDGVTSISAIDTKTIRVNYDPKIVGGRDLIKRGWRNPMQLAPLRPDPALDASGKHVWNMGWMTLLATVLTIPVLVMAWAPLPPRELAYGSASLALATIVQVVVAGPFYPKAIKDLVFSHTVEVDMLIVLSTSAAYVFSVVSFGYMATGKPLSTGEFFETSTLLVTLIMLGRFIAALARQKAAESISIRSLQISTATLVDQASVETEIDARLLQYGDIFKLAPDCAIPTDGTVISGSSEVNESMITGEALPVAKFPKSTVRAGTINGSGTLTVRLTRLPGDNTISTIANMVDEAKLSKPKIQDIADRIAGCFVPVVVALSIITFVIWVAVGVAVRKQSSSTASVQALTYAITVLIVSCPCALGLAVPMVIVVASGVAAQHGVIFKSASSIEVAYRATDVVFDKSGTLTRGELSISVEEYLVNDKQEVKSLLLGLIGSIKHPVSAAIALHLKKDRTLAATGINPKSLPGKGVEGTCSGRAIRAGNSRWLGLEDDPLVRAVLTQDLTAFFFTIDDNLVAVYGLEDTLRPGTGSTISALQKAGMAVHILSGDDDGAVHSVATKLNICTAHVHSRCSPSDKQAYIQSLLSQHPSTNAKRKKPIVLFCGDGTNDAVALASATVGIHMSTGTDVAKSAADVVLMRPDLSCILTMITISRKAVKRIAFNFVWSFVYNLVAVLLAGGAFVNVRLPPAFAGLGELVSVLPVIAIAVALRWLKI